ncbi:MAG: exopolysaccharide biosynthesis protein [Clostridia bacterium]|nr:exopolysaccharide biosynthesis protein [Clostridia bacterium]
MILILLGTQNNSFTRLLDAVQENINKKIITDRVIVQAGFTKFDSKDMKIFSMIDKNEFSKLQDEADLIITHGGVGSIISSIEKGKKVIVAPRLKRYNEHVNNHQIQIAKKFNRQGYVKYVINMKNLGKVIKSMDNFCPKEYKKSESNVISIIENYIDNN